MKKALLEMLSSKKALAAFGSVVVFAGVHWGFKVDATDVTELVMPIWLYIGAQAIHDHGKAAALINKGKK